MLSHGGIASVEEARRLAAGTALSGPAGGVAAAVALTRQGADENLITFDMGGTSTDIALVQSGKPILTGSRSVAEARIALPSLDIVTLGAGGGSIAHINRAGLLQVGPQSAGADPGPACYGAGGSTPTVTDANLALGLLDPNNFLGGRRPLNLQAATTALTELGTQLHLDPIQTAAGVRRLVNARMADGLRVATVRRGVDPRRFTLLAFGGAAGLHITEIAATIGIPSVIVPQQAAVLSAWGMLNTNLRTELMRSLSQAGPIDIQDFRRACIEMEREGRTRLAWFQGEIQVRHSADMRYGEQVYELNVPLDNPNITAEALAEAFHQTHEAAFTYALRDRPPVLVNARTSVTGILPTQPTITTQPEPATQSSRRIYLDTWHLVPVHRFASLTPNTKIQGPAIIESDTTTILLRPQDQAQLNPKGWLEITIS